MSEGVEKAKAEIAEMPEEARKGFLDQWGESEELHEDLNLCVTEVGPTGTWIKHPLLFSPMHHPLMNGMVNKQYAQKRKALKEYEEEGRWIAIVMVLYERPYRLEAFLKYEEYLTDEDYWILLASIWTDSENIWQNEEVWRVCFLEHREGRVEHLMEDDERGLYESLPDVVRVYRGYAHDGRAEGMSWTLDKERAEFFATRFLHLPDENARVVKGTVKKKHILAYFESRKEKEVVVFPEWVTDREEYEV